MAIKKEEIIDFLILDECYLNIACLRFGYSDLGGLSKNIEIKCDKEDVKLITERIGRAIGMQYLEIEPILEGKELSRRVKYLKINKKKFPKKADPHYEESYYKIIFFGKITPTGIIRYEELKSKIESHSGIIRYEELKSKIESHSGIRGFAIAFKEMIEKIIGYRYLISIALTGAILLSIFVFDIKVSEYLSKMPLVSSIIDIDTIKKFEDVNENDDFYKEIKKELNLSGTIAQTIKSDSQGASENTMRSESRTIFSWIGDLFSSKSQSVAMVSEEAKGAPKSEDVTPSETNNSQNQKITIPMISDIKVKIVSDNEKVFRITLKNGEVIMLPVKKDASGKIGILIGEKVKKRLEELKNSLKN